MSTFRDVLADICGRVPQLVQRIERFSYMEPWSLLPAKDRVNALPEVAGRACLLALRVGAGRRQCVPLLEIAAHHGLVRRRQGLGESSLFEELAFVREAIWSDIQARFGRENQVAAEIILRIDMALTLASQASLRGYFRVEFEERGLWPRALTELETAWAPPTNPEERVRHRLKRRLQPVRARPKYRIEGEQPLA